jgi:hypothetical protein
LEFSSSVFAFRHALGGRQIALPMSRREWAPLLAACSNAGTLVTDSGTL